MESDPVAVDLNVDAALVLKSLVGIDTYPSVLALMPNIFDVADQARVHAVVLDELTQAGIVEDDRVHPRVVEWLEGLYRPDMELVARVMDTGNDGGPQAMLRLSLVRAGELHVVAMRSGDHVIVQEVFCEERQFNTTAAAALVAAMGPGSPLRFDPLTATLDQFAAASSDDPGEVRSALQDLGAEPRTARAISTATSEAVRRAEILMVEHRDGGSVQTDVCLSVLDAPAGRVVVTPRMAVDGQYWSTYAPGDDATVAAGVGSLVELLPSRKWFGTSRTG